MKRRKTAEHSIAYAGLRFRVRVRPVRYSRIQFGDKGPVLTVPPGVDPMGMLMKKQRWVEKTRDRLREARREAASLTLVRRSGPGFDALVRECVTDWAARLRVRPGAVTLRRMKRRWGSCHHDGRITLNRCLQWLPDHLVAYVVCHELLHLRIRRHGPRFKGRMLELFPDARRHEEELNLYGFRLLACTGPGIRPPAGD